MRGQGHETGRNVIRRRAMGLVADALTAWPAIVRSLTPVSTSQTSTSPRSLPTARYEPSPAQVTLQICGDSSVGLHRQCRSASDHSHFGVRREKRTHSPRAETPPVSAFQTYTASPRPMATMLSALQASRLR